MESYLRSCESTFWKNVFKAELDYLLSCLSSEKDILSVGCGPAIIEAGLAERGFNITGLDVSKVAIEKAADSIRKFVGTAEKMDFAEED